MSNFGRHPSDQELFHLAEGEVSPRRRQALEAHLNECRQCQEACAQWAEVQRQVSGTPVPDAPAAVILRLRERLSEAVPLPAPAVHWGWVAGLTAIAGLLVIGCWLWPREKPWSHAPGEARKTLQAPSSVAAEPPAEAGPGRQANGRPPSPVASPERVLRPSVEPPPGEPEPGSGANGPRPKAAEPVARVRFVQGHPVVVGPEGAMAAAPGTPVRPGDQVRTGGTDRALVTLSDGGQLALGFDSAAKIAAHRSVGEKTAFAVNLFQGQVWTWSPGDGGEIVVQTARGSGRILHGEALVREGAARAAGGGLPEVELVAFRGGVNFRTPGGEALIVPPGQAALAGRAGAGVAVRDQPLSRLLRTACAWGTRPEIWQVPPLSVVELLAGLDAPRVLLGVKVTAPPGASPGLRVVSVDPADAAARAGLRTGDLLLAVGGRPVSTLRDLAAAELLLPGQAALEVSVRRDDAALSLKLTPTVTAPHLSASFGHQLGAVGTLVASGDLVQALAAARSLTAAQPTCTAAWLNLGLLQEYQGEDREALELYAKAATLSPASAEVQQAVGREYARQGNAPRAISALQKAVDLGAPPAVDYLLGKVLLLDGRLTQAREVAEALLGSPSSEKQAWGHVLSGRLAYMVGHDTPGATDQYARAAALEPSNTEAVYCLADVSLVAGQLGRASELAQALLRVQPDFLRAINLMGGVAFRRGDLTEADRWFQHGHALQPSASVFLCNLGRVAWTEKKFAKAAGYLQEALKVDDSLSLAHLDLGDALAATGDWRTAADQYARALELDPGFTEALGKLAALYSEHGRPDTARQFVLRYDLSAATG